MRGKLDRMATAAGGNGTRCARPDFVTAAGIDQTAGLEVDITPAHERRLAAPLAEQHQHLEVWPERPARRLGGLPHDRQFPIRERAPRAADQLGAGAPRTAPAGERACV